MIYSQDTLSINTHGQAYSKAMKQLTTGVYLAEVCLIGLFAITTAGQTSAAGPLALMVVFLVITVLYHLLLNHTLKTLEKDVGNNSAVLSKEGDVEAPASSIATKPVGFLVKLLRPPPMPAFDPWFSTLLSEYTPEIRREAYLNPAIWKPTPKLWIPRDEMGISTREKLETSKVIEITDAGAWFDEKGKVTTLLAEPDQKGEDINRATEAPIWEEPIYY